MARFDLRPLLLVTLAGCGTLLGLDDYVDGAGDGTTTTTAMGGGGSGTTTTSSTSSTSASLGGGGEGASGAGGADGGTGAGGTFCTPNESQPCYSGPPDTEGHGICKAGSHECLSDGSAFGPCFGQVVPKGSEDCATPDDDNCDGVANEGCPCAPNSTQPCYTGAAGTSGVGICHGGTQTCDPQGTAWGPCVGEQTPLPETCNTPDDDNCDGQVNEGGVGCVCPPNSSQSCYSGPGGTAGVGICKAGTQQCNSQGTAWGACTGEVLPAVESCAQAADEDCDGHDCVAWASIFGDAASQFGTDVAIDPSGNVVVVGWFYGSLQIGAQTLVGSVNSEIFVAKFGPTGAPLWAKQFGDANSQRPYGVAVDASGNIFLTGFDVGSTDFGGGALTPGVFVAKLSPNGSHVWSKSFGGTNPSGTTTRGTGVATDSAGNVVVVGGFQGTMNAGPAPLTSAGSTDAFVAKLAGATGAGMWSKRFGDASAQSSNAVALDSAGNILIAGTIGGSADYGGGALVSAGSNDVTLVKLDGNGSHSWSKRFGDAASQVGTGVAVDGAGNAVVTGYFAGAMDFGGGALTSAGGTDAFLAKISNIGTHVWSKRFGDASAQLGQDVAVDASGAVYLGCDVTGSADFGGGALTSAGLNDVMLAKFTSGGAYVWSRDANGTGDDSTGALTALSAGGLLVTGGVQGPVDFGLGSLATAGGWDFYLARFGQ